MNSNKGLFWVFALVLVVVASGSGDDNQNFEKASFEDKNLSKEEWYIRKGEQGKIVNSYSVDEHQNEVEVIKLNSPSDDPPPYNQVTKMARYIVQKSNWTSIATISTLSPVKGYPFANVLSISDGTPTNSSGIPYMYLTPNDFTVTDLEKDSRASLTMSLAQTEYCTSHNYDQEDPRCAHVILAGRIVSVTEKDEIEFARNALFTRHPQMPYWPKDHGWFFAKLDIEFIVVRDFFGGAKTVTINDYYSHAPL